MNNFCRYLSNGHRFLLNYDNNISYGPCCYYNKPLNDLTKIQDYRNELDTVNDWTNNCSLCQTAEEVNGVSGRTRSFKDIENDTDLFLDLQLDMTCNGGCVICGPHFSTFWQQQKRKFDIHSFNESKIRLEDNHLDTIKSIANIQKCTRINFSGGDTMLMKLDIELLNEIKDKSKLNLQYATNGSNWPGEERINLWKQCKSVNVALSIDGVESQFEYIRYPLVWKEVEENIQRMKQTLPDNVIFRIGHTTTPMSILYSDRMFNWVNKNISHNRLGVETKINFHGATGVWNMNSLSEELRTIVINKYGPESVVSKVASRSQYNERSHIELLNFTNKWDKHRNLYWQEIFPEVVHYLDRP